MGETGIKERPCRRDKIFKLNAASNLGRSIFGGDFYLKKYGISQKHDNYNSTFQGNVLVSFKLLGILYVLSLQVDVSDEEGSFYVTR